MSELRTPNTAASWAVFTIIHQMLVWYEKGKLISNMEACLKGLQEMADVKKYKGLFHHKLIKI